MRISVDEPSALSTWMRGGESWRVSEGKMRKIDGAAAVRARPGDESVARAYLDLVAAAKLGDHANLVALRELGQRLVHQVSHVLASPAHRGSAHGARVPSDVTQSGDRGKQIPRRGRESQSPASVDLANAAADVHHGCVHYPRSLVHTLRVRCVATPRAPHPTARPRLRLRPPGSPRRRLTRISKSTPPHPQTSTRRLPTRRRRCTCP